MRASLGLRWCALAILGATASRVAAPAAPSVQRTPGAIEVADGRVRLRVTALSDTVVRVQEVRGEAWPEDASWVIDPAARARRASVEPIDEAGAIGWRTAALEVRVDRATLALTVLDRAGHTICADAPDTALGGQGPAFTLHKRMPATEHYVGLGDKAGPLDRRGHAYVNWNSDVYGWQESSDPLYKSVPFFIGTGTAAGSWGLYLDNTWRSWFDFGHTERDVLAFGAAGGPIDYYVIYGPTMAQVLERYTALSGRAPLPPLWSLGYQQSRYSYMSAEEVRAIAQRLRAERIPADVLWLDIDYQDRNRPFTVNRQRFPDLGGLARELGSEGLRLVTITDLHIANAPQEGYAPFDSGTAGDQFVHRADGSVYSGEVWPGAAVFPDFTQARTRRWWGELYREFVADGIAGFWNDMNEPAVFRSPNATMPLDNVHRIEEPGFATRTASHAEIHNIFGLQNARATYEGLQRLRPGERPFVMTRASFAGGQRYGASWTGDNSSTWNHLAMSVPGLINLGLSGFAYIGDDVGGFKGTPSPELFTRWIELTAFMPLFRAHSTKGVRGKEPWVDGPAHTAIRRAFIEERYRLLPYLYALADENARTGAPLMRPLFFDYPDALEMTCEQPTAFLLGAQLLIAPPPVLESPATYEVCLPHGGWYDYWTGAPVTGDSPLVLTPALTTLPVYVRAGTILPRQPLVQSTTETPRGALALDVYPGEDCHGTLYLDDGHSLDYQRGAFLRQRVRCTRNAGTLRIEFEAREGRFTPWWQQIDLRIHGWSGPAHVAGMAAETLPGGPDELRLRIADRRAPGTLVITSGR